MAKIIQKPQVSLMLGSYGQTLSEVLHQMQVYSAMPLLQPLMDAGLDSLGAVELRNSLQARLAVSLPVTVTYDYPSTAALADFIFSQLSATRLQSVASNSALSFPVSSHADVTAFSRGTCIIGSSCRYPGSCASPSGFWAAICSSADLPGVTPHQRWNTDALYEPDRAVGKVYARFGAYLEDASSFDSSLFGLPHVEALALDPQTRMLLEETCIAMDGRVSGWPAGSAGTYVGCMYQEYTDVIAQGGGKVSAAAATGNSLSFMVGR